MNNTKNAAVFLDRDGTVIEDRGYLSDTCDVVGGKMVVESFRIKKEEKGFDPTKIGVLLVLSVATSIDALAIGATLSLITSSVFLAVCVIGVVTLVLSYLGVLVGKRFGHIFENKIEALGGVVLIFIGIKIVFEHTVF